MPDRYEEDWYAETCSLCVAEQFKQIVLERYGKTEKELEAEGKELSEDESRHLWKEAENRCVQLREKNEDRFMVWHENKLERAMHGMTDRTGSPVFPSSSEHYVLCPYHKIRLLGTQSATLCIMIHSAMKIQKRVRHSDFEMFGIDRKTVDQCLGKAERRLKRYKSRVEVDADLRTELEKERERIEKAKRSIFGAEVND